MEESKLSMRQETLREVFKSYMDEYCREDGDQDPNLSAQQRRGLKSIKSRIKRGEILIAESDKSGKFVVCTPGAYKKMGSVHTIKDRPIDHCEIKKCQSQLRGHTSMWLKITSMGAHWGQEQRIRESLVLRSETKTTWLYLKVNYQDQEWL